MLFHHLVCCMAYEGWPDLSVSLFRFLTAWVTLRPRLLAFLGKMRTQHFISDSLCQQQLRSATPAIEALFNVQSNRESTRDSGAKKTSPLKFCEGWTHQHMFGYEVGVLPAVPPENVKGSPLMPHTYTLYAFALIRHARAPVCKDLHRNLHSDGHPQHIS